MGRAMFVPEKSSMYPKEVVYVLGGGTSLKTFDFDLLKPKFVVGCNDAYKLGHEIVDVVFWGDNGWWKTHKERVIKRYRGLVVSCNSRAKTDDYVSFMGRQSTGLVNGRGHPGLAWNFSSGACATNLALRFGAKFVILLGFDMKLGKGGEANWHPNEVSHPAAGSYIRFMRGFRSVRDELHKKFPGSVIINANPESEMPYFPMMKRDEALRCY